jgi:hypothetical protein
VQQLESQPVVTATAFAADKQQQQQQQQQPLVSSEGADAATTQQEEQQEQQHANGVAELAGHTAAGKSARLLEELQTSYAALQSAVAAAADATAEVC